ncbi:5'-nucleotidase [Actinokineospora iranica]|uniref:5'-nucleotidase n=2 Tax=Actinokineospora iranica TaxID=1271860 RepID=A0A1G6YT36_9PSEU|nr:5'-nucleotidase [Actinokineospora iranica]
MAESTLVTNDDGIESPGLAALARAAVAAGARVTVAAPLSEASGTSASLVATEDHQRIVTEERALPGLVGVPAFGVGAHPGLIAHVGCQGAFGGTPDVVLSGINRGANIGRAVLHSGTVGAALTASVVGVRGLAVSLDVGFDGNGQAHWETAASVVAAALDLLLASPPATVLSVNVPNVPVDRLREPRWARLAEFGSVRSAVERLSDGTIEVTTVATDTEPAPDTDAALLAAGHVTVTALRSVSEDQVVQNDTDAVDTARSPWA